jgi:DNA-binding beta-propeller fold protein YncE
MILLASALLLAPLASAQTNVLFEENFSADTGQFTGSGRVYTDAGGIRLRGTTGTLTSPNISTADSSNIVLSFDINTEGLDPGETAVAELSINGGAFNSVYSTATTTETRASVNLGAAAANATIQIRFRILASSFFEYLIVDDVVIEGEGDSQNPPTGAVFEENFDAGAGQFSSSGSVYTGSYGIRLRGTNGAITSPSIDTSATANLLLSFDVVTSGLDAGEVGIAELAINGGAYTQIYSTNSTNATRAEVSLPAAAANTNINLRFRVIANSFFEYLTIDDVLIEADGIINPPTGDVPPIGDFVTFESGQVRPLVLSSNGNRLYAANTPDNRVEVYDVSGTSPVLLQSISVGLEPVAVNLLNDGELWVVNHLSDSVSIVDVSTALARIKNTLLVGDEPRDVIFAGTNNRFAFITAAHRGQNAPFDPQLQTEGIGRADVWVFNSADQGSALGGTPLTILNMFGDTLRGLARNAAGTQVYAAVFNSGNRTTVLTDDIGDGGIDKPPPLTSADNQTQPGTGLIVQFNGSDWVDGGDPTRGVPSSTWNNRINLSLPDNDVFVIDASGSVPQVVDQLSGVGTTLFNLAVSPTSNNIYVSNQEALNLRRFEGPGSRSTTVRGHFVENRISVIDNGNVQPRHLNKHINYSTALGSVSENARALAIPLQMAISNDGDDLYLVAMGSNKLARFSTTQLDNDAFTPSTANQLVLTGGGPTGVVLDDNRNRAYVLTRFDNGISVVSTASAMNEIAHVSMFNPEPAVVKNGRRFLYDAAYTSSRGDSSCAGCHVFGDMDHLAWDLGNPDGVVEDSPNTYNENIPFFGRIDEFHPMKGPMTTQSFRGMKGNGPLHWRGDRTGASRSPGETLEEQAFEDFNVAFVGLVGREQELTETEMDAFAKFALALTYPPNPIRNLDNSNTSRQTQALNVYNNVTSDIISTCNGCHRLNPALGQFGTDGTMATEGPGVAEDMKIPHLRNMYQKVGMFAVNSQLSQFPNLGPQIRGFGFDNSGAHGTIFDFLSEDVFTLNDADTRLVEELALAFPSDMNPIVGQQVTVTPDNRNRGDVNGRLNLLVQRALVINPVPECELVAHTVLQNQALGFVFDNQSVLVASDPDIGATTVNDLINTATQQGSNVTFTCVPPGNGTRIGVDRDSDGVFDGD